MSKHQLFPGPESVPLLTLAEPALIRHQDAVMVDYFVFRNWALSLDFFDLAPVHLSSLDLQVHPSPCVLDVPSVWSDFYTVCRRSFMKHAVF